MKTLLFVVAVAMNLVPQAQDQARIGSLRFSPPKGWIRAEASGPTVAIFVPSDLPSGKTCTIKIFPEESDKDGFRPWYNRRWNRTITGGHQILRMSEMASRKMSGIDVLIRSGAYKEGSGEGYILVIGLSFKDKFFCVWYQSNDFDYMEKRQHEVYEMFGSFELVEGGAQPTANPTGNPPASGATVPPVKPGESPPGTVKPGENTPSASVPNTFRAGLWQEDSMGSARLDRLAEIAKLIQDPKANTVALLTEAAKLCGFVIWTEERAKVAAALGSPPLFLAITDTEIKEYAEMFNARQEGELVNLISAIDVIFKGVGSSSSCGPHIVSWLRNGFISGNPSVRALTHFLHQLYFENPQKSGVAFGENGTVLDSIQTLFILRVVTEEIGGPIRKWIHKQQNSDLFASLNPVPQEPEAPGWAEDAFVGGVTGLWEATIGIMDAGETVLGRANQFIGRANALLTVAKFIASYVCLKSKMWVVQGEPLIRTTDRDPGDRRTVVAKFSIDGFRITDWMKDNRALVSLTGLDLDMEKSGDLKGIETFWMLNQNMLPTKQLVWAARGSGGLDKVRTNDKGEARVDFDGAPQSKVLDRQNIIAVEKQVWIKVTPQMKAVEMKQDLVDAVLGAIGIRGGPIGFITPLTEMLYRLKWTGTAHMNLRVRDWIEGENIGQFKIEVKGNGRELTQSSAIIWNIDRSVEFRDVGMKGSGGQEVQQVDPSILGSLSKKDRADMEEAMKKFAEMAKIKTFEGKIPGTAKIVINDNLFFRMPDGCEKEAKEDRTSWIGDYDGVFVKEGPDGTFMMFRVDLDLVKKTASVIGIASTKVKYFKSGGGLKAKGDPYVGIFDDIKFRAPFDKDKPLVIPLQETPDIYTPGWMNYFGSGTINFTFGPLDKFNGQAIFSYSVTKKVKK